MRSWAELRRITPPGCPPEIRCAYSPRRRPVDARYSAAAAAHTDVRGARRRPRNTLDSHDTAGNRRAVAGEPKILPVNCESS